MKIAKELLKLWQNRLKVGNKRTVHLNCVPGKSSYKFDITKLDIVDDRLSQNFIEQLTTQLPLKYKCSWINERIEEKEYKKLEKDRKSFQNLVNEVQSIKADKGVNSFGFGYPIITKKDSKDGKLTCAPLIIWSLRIARNKDAVHSWTIERSEDDPIYINELLINHFQIDLGINLEDFSAENSANELVDKDKINEICREFCNKISKKELKFEVDFSSLEKMKDKDYYNSSLNSRGTIKFYNSGLFSIFKVSKQSIIKDYKSLFGSNIDISSFNRTNFNSITPLDTDPFLQFALNSLKSHRNIYIQGPPGTGKSQGLATILINAVQNKRKTIVVCEKRSALEVLQEILEKKGLFDYAILIRDASKDRRKIVDKVRARCDKKKAGRADVFKRNKIKTTFKEKITEASKLIIEINSSFAKLDKNIVGFLKWNDLVALFLKLRKLLSEKGINNEIKIQFKEITEEYFHIIKKKVKEGEKIWRNYQKYRDYFFLKKEVFDGTESFKLRDKIKEDFKEYENIIVDKEESVISFMEKNRDLCNKNSGITCKIFEIFSRPIFWVKKKLGGFFSNILLSISSVRFRKYFQARRDFQKVYEALKKNYYNFSGNLSFCTESIKRIRDIIYKCNDYFNHRDRLFFKEYEWYTFYNNLEKTDRQVIDSLKDSSDWESLISFKFYEKLLKRNESIRIPFDHSQSEKLRESLKEYEKFQREDIESYWSIECNKAKRRFENDNDRGLTLANLYNKRKSNRFNRHSLRQIIKEDEELFTSIFPIILTTPDVASNLFQGSIGYFDIVLFDESSQLRIEDSFPALLKGKQLVIAGDEHQMPPSNYFGKKLEEETEDFEKDEIKLDDILSSCESLLDFAIESKFVKNHLDFHYRSRHQDLIEFSNQAFYNGRLEILPTAVDYKCIEFFEVAGNCIENKNKKEADKVIEILRNEIKKSSDGSYPSVGVATFNISQKNYIENRIAELYFDKDFPSFTKKMDELEKKGFFVKNLENIQGDERDIIILSTTYGKNEEGKFLYRFGPINSYEKGYKLLNVIITRARNKIYLCSSVPSDVYSKYKEYLKQEGRNNRKAVFFAYLAYARAVSDRNLTMKASILETLKLYQDNTGFVESSSEKEKCRFVNFVGESIKKELSHIKLSLNQFLGGIQINLLLSNSEGKIFAIDCVGSNVKANNESYLLDFHKERILRRLKIDYHRIWSASWWKNEKEEKKALIGKINAVLDKKDSKKSFIVSQN